MTFKAYQVTVSRHLRKKPLAPERTCNPDIDSQHLTRLNPALLTTTWESERGFPLQHGLKAHRLNLRQRLTPFPYESHLYHTNHAFVCRFEPERAESSLIQTWTKPDLKRAIEKKPKTPFSKKNNKTELFLSHRSGSEGVADSFYKS